MAKKCKKTFAMLMVMVMLIGMIPVQALAEENEPVIDLSNAQAVEGLDVNMTIEGNDIVVAIAPVAAAQAEPAAEVTDVIVVETPEGELKWETNLTLGENVQAEVTEITSNTKDEEVDGVKAEVLTESATVETTGTTDEGASVEGTETFTETTTTTSDAIVIESVVEGNERTEQENMEVTPEDKNLPEVELPVNPDDSVFDVEEGTTTDEETGVTTTIDKNVEVETTESTTTTVETVTTTENEKVEENGEVIFENTTTTTIEKTTEETTTEDGKTETDESTLIKVKVEEFVKEVIGDVKEGEDDLEYDYTEIKTTIEREVTTEGSDIVVKDESTITGSDSLKPEEYEGKYYDNPGWLADGTIAGRPKNDPIGLTNGNLADNGSDFSKKPEEQGYDFELTGSGDSTYAACPVVLDIVYVKDENGNPVTDENGNFVIDMEKTKLATSGTSRPQQSGMVSAPGQIVLKKTTNPETGEGEYFYTYCIDLYTGTKGNHWYKMSNLEDAGYFPDEESASMLRAIVSHGYWGTDANVYETNEDGTVKVDENGNRITKKDENGKIVTDENVEGSLASMKALLRKTYAEDATITITDVNGVEKTYNIHSLIDGLKEHEALAVTQGAIWSYSNGCQNTLDGEDGEAVIGVQSSLKLFNTKNGGYLRTYKRADNPESDARMQALYECLMGLTPEEATHKTTVLNESNTVEDVIVTIGDKVEGNEANYDDNEDNDVYETDVNFTLAFVPDPNSDDLLVRLLDKDGKDILDKDGKPIVRRLAGENSEGQDYETIEAVDGVYTLPGLQLSENSDFTFDLKLEGLHLLEKGVYIYSATGGQKASQTLVGVAEGTQNVNVSASMTIRFDVDESKHVVAERHWRTENDPVIEEREEEDNPPPVRYRVARGVGQLETIIDEEVPLAEVPQTGDNSILWFALILMSVCGLCILHLSDKKCKA